MPPLGREFNDVFQELYDENDPLLTGDDLQLVTTAYEAAQEEYERNAQNNIDHDFEVNETLNLRRIQKVAELIKLSYKARKDFLEFYPTWIELREKNIKIISDAGNSMIKDGKNSNISRIVGASVSFLGGATLLGAFIAAPFTGGLSLPFAVAGGVTSAIGSATALGTSAVEFGLNAKDMDKAKEALREDKKHYIRMEEWMKRSQEFVDAVEDLIGYRAMDKMRKDFKKLFSKFNDIREIISGPTRNQFMTSFMELSIKAVTDFIKDPITAAFLHLIPIVISLLSAVFIIRADNILIFDSIIFVGRMLSAGLVLLDVGVDTVCTSLTIARGGAVVSKSVGRAVVHGAIATLSMAIDVAIIVVASIDIHKGSISKQAQSLLDAAKDLQKELDFFEEVYIKLTKKSLQPRLLWLDED